MNGIVVVGTGQAGFQLGASLREGGYAGPVTLVGDEPGLPYGRPPLSKAYMLGKTDAAGLALRPDAYFAEHRMTLRGRQAGGRDRPGGSPPPPRLGEALPYDHLVLATGARNRPLPVPGADLPGVHQLRTLAEADALKAALAEVRSVAVVGAGFIGLEFAAICAQTGIAVTVIEGLDRPLARAVSAEMAALIEASHVAAGVRFLFGHAVARIVGPDRARAVVLADGREVAADLVLVGIGVIPNDALATSAGLRVENGVAVDAMLATEDPAISAIGDCASFPSPHAEGAGCGSNRCRTPSTAPAASPPASPAGPPPLRRCRGSGATRARSSSRSPACPGRRTRRCAGADPVRASRSSATGTGG